MRRALVLLAAAVAFLSATGTAFAHAQLLKTDPPGNALLAASPPQVRFTFSEPVELPRADSIDVVDSSGVPVNAGNARLGADARTVEIPLRPGLPSGTYTVRWSVVGADSHVVGGVWVFGVGSGPVGQPYLQGTGKGPSETGPWGTSSRFLELVGLGGLVALIAFRWLVWAPALRRRVGSLPADRRETVLAWGRDTFWVAFGVLAVGAMLAEGYLLIVESASVLGTGVLRAARDTTGISEVLGGTRFGSLVQLRGALLFGVFALGAVLFLREYGSSAAPRPAALEGPRWTALLMGGLLLAVLGGVADQGHASVDQTAALAVAAQLLHIVAVSVWIGGLALVALVHVRLPRLDPQDGPALSAAVLARFSQLALAAVTVAVGTGVLRAVEELNDPAELWNTAYGRSILIKVGVLIPIAVLALYNRRIVVALRRVRRPNAPTVRRVRQLASAELLLSLAIVVVASILAAQVPGAAG